MSTIEKVEHVIKNSFSGQSNLFLKKAIAAVGMLVLAILLYYQTSVLDILKYITFQAVYVLLPGYLLYRILRFKFDSACLVIWSYGLGVASIILQFIMLSILQWLPGMYYIGPMMSVMAVFLLWVQPKQNEFASSVKEIPIQFWFIYAILLFTTVVGVILPNPQPGFLSTSSYYQDILWNIGNAEALLNHFPPYDLRVSDVVFKYHFFTTVYIAAIAYITNIELFTIVYRFYHISELFLIIGAVYALGSVVLQEKRKALFFTWIYFFTSCASMVFTLRKGYGLFLNISFLHLTVTPICGYDLAFPMYILAATLCIIQLKSHSIKWGYLVATILFIFICTGTKGPSGFLIFGSLLVTWAISKIFSKSTWNSILLLATTAFMALFVYFFFIKAPDGNNSLFLYPGFTVQETLIGRYFPKYIHNQYIVSIIETMLIPLHFWCFLPFASIPFVYWCIEKLKVMKTVVCAEIFIGSLAISGTTLTYLLAQRDLSQLYFIMFSIPFIELIAVLWLADNYPKLPQNRKKIFVNMLIVATISATFSIVYEMKNGIQGIVSIYKDKHQVVDSQPEWNSMTTYEYEAMTWLKDNTARDCLIASDRYYREPGQDDSRYFYYSTFSGRQFFLEGWRYESTFIKEHIIPQKLSIMNELYMDNGIAKDEIMKRNHIDYVIVSRFVNPNSEFLDKSLEIIFANRDIKIYRAIGSRH
jgi:hypothetical protein